jgi:three-Cys-motif partner protein
MKARARTSRPKPTKEPTARAAPRAKRAAPATPPSSRVTAARWPELKLDIVRHYGAAWSRVMSRQPGLAHYYIEGFSGPGVHLGEMNGELVPGSPLNALRVEPPFRHYFLLDLDGGRAATLRKRVGGRADVALLEGDGHEPLLCDVLPRVRAEDYRRALCVLDPCGTRLDWRVVEMAGRLKTIDLFVSLPVVDEQGDALWRGAGAPDVARLDRIWGDDSWREIGAEGIATAFARRLREVARFDNVLGPWPIREDAGAEATGHVFFASRVDTANHVIEDLFARSRG